jgi:hypothetical protein
MIHLVMSLRAVTPLERARGNMMAALPAVENNRN